MKPLNVKKKCQFSISIAFWGDKEKNYEGYLFLSGQIHISMEKIL